MLLYFHHITKRAHRKTTKKTQQHASLPPPLPKAHRCTHVHARTCPPPLAPDHACRHDGDASRDERNRKRRPTSGKSQLPPSQAAGPEVWRCENTTNPFPYPPPVLYRRQRNRRHGARKTTTNYDKAVSVLGTVRKASKIRSVMCFEPNSPLRTLCTACVNQSEAGR